MSVRAWFISLWTRTSEKFKNFFEGPGGVVVRQALGTVIEQAGAIGISLLMSIATQKVAALNLTTMTNDSKRIQALNYLKGYALDQGLVVGEATIRYVLETAVSATKGRQPA